MQLTYITIVIRSYYKYTSLSNVLIKVYEDNIPATPTTK